MTLFARRFRGSSASPFPAVVIALAYLSFGLWALVASGFRLFFLVFVVPAVLVLAACPEPRRAG